MIKLLHILAFMFFVSGLIYSLFNSRNLSQPTLSRLTLSLLIALVMSAALGLILVPQKGYFYTTPWIMAAMIFCGFLAVLLLVIYLFQIRRVKAPASRGSSVIVNALLSVSILISIAIIHDAVTKTTELVL